jgi:hypothetical protein
MKLVRILSPALNIVGLCHKQERDMGMLGALAR